MYKYFKIDFNVIGPNTNIGLISLTPTLDDNSLRFVLSWESSPKDLDIHTIFQVSRFQLCGVYFAMKQCVGTVLDSDNNNGGPNGVETITISPLGNYIYTIAVNKYIEALDPSVPVQWSDIALNKSKAKVAIFAPNYMDAIKIVTVPMIVDDSTVYGGMENNSPESFEWWMIVCFDGSIGVDSIVTVNKFKYVKPTYKDCSTILKG
jgi:hypothetical protein